MSSFSESDHPRGHATNAGRFATKPQSDPESNLLATLQAAQAATGNAHEHETRVAARAIAASILAEYPTADHLRITPFLESDEGYFPEDVFDADGKELGAAPDEVADMLYSIPQRVPTLDYDPATKSYPADPAYGWLTAAAREFDSGRISLRHEAIAPPITPAERIAAAKERVKAAQQAAFAARVQAGLATREMVTLMYQAAYPGGTQVLLAQAWDDDDGPQVLAVIGEDGVLADFTQDKDLPGADVRYDMSEYSDRLDDGDAFRQYFTEFGYGEEHNVFVIPLR
ncbi:hypothetical protein [Rathayibacter iranicus]|nr:hypothetical protein [Rathayibacter iranicus]PWJ61535.1 hypothetical protein B0H03_1167 [Rathayibacter iranicus NCPPB 2253 = VKM Ac-1602]